jgi:hypothetical protein
MGPVQPPAEFAAPSRTPEGLHEQRPSAAQSRAATRRPVPPGPIAPGQAPSGRAPGGSGPSRRDRDSLDGRRADESIRHLRTLAGQEAEPSTLKALAVPFFAVLRARNWVTGLVIPIVAAMAVGIAVVIVVGANGRNGGR